MKHKLIIIVLLVFAQNASSQTVEEVLSNIYKQYSSNESLRFETTYNLYKTFDAKEIHQSYRGVFHKNGDNDIYMKINDTEILNNKEVSIKASHTEKALLLSNPELNVAGDFDMKELLKIYKQNNFEDKQDYWEIELIANEMTLPHSKIVLHVTKDYLLKKQVFFYSESVNFSKDYKKSDIQTPKLEITYSNYNRDLMDEKLFATSKFLQIKNDKSAVLSSSLKGYELLDKRY